MTALEVDGLTVEYNAAGYRLRPLDGLSFQVGDGELAVVVGPSGCGKTTLLSCLAGLLTPTAGSIRAGDTEVTALTGSDLTRYRMHRVGIVFQAFNLIPSLNARGNVMTPLRLAGHGRAESRRRAQELLARVDLTQQAGTRPGRMSGGQQQRVAIARALAHDPPLILADEPTAHLDFVQVEGVLRLLRELAAPGRLVLVVTHDDRVTHLADRVIELVPRFAPSDRPPESVSLLAGQVLFTMGELGDLVYVVEEGSAEIYRPDADGSDQVLMVAQPGEYFGELGPVLNLPRSASARGGPAGARLTGYPVRAFRRRFPSKARTEPEPVAG